MNEIIDHSEIIGLAKDRKFDSKMVSSSEWRHSSLESLRWLSWMTELQKWLREKHDIDCEESRNVYSHEKQYIPVISCNGIQTMLKLESSYENALEEALKRGLRLVKNK